MLKTIFEHANCQSIEIYHYQTGQKAKDSQMYKDINISRHFSDKQNKCAKLKSFDPSLIIQ